MKHTIIDVNYDSYVSSTNLPSEYGGEDIYNEFITSFNSLTGVISHIGTSKASLYFYKDPDFDGYITLPAPININSETREISNFINWATVSHPDVQGYNIYRSPAGANQWTRINAELVTQTSYRDDTAVPNVPYDYRITTMGLYNIEGEPSEPVTATLILEPNFTLSTVLSTQSTSVNSNVEYYITSESIEQYATLIDLRTDILPNGINAAFTPSKLRPGEVASLKIEIPSNIEPGDYSFEVVGTADGNEHRVPLKLTVVETGLAESVISLDMSSPDIEFGSSVYASGRIIPPVSSEVSVSFTGSSGIETVTTISSDDGTFTVDFEPPVSCVWTAQASWPGDSKYAGAQTEETSFEALSGRTKITCTTDASADAEVGWQMTIKGKLFPNPEVGSVTMYVKKPDGTEETIDGLLINELGYYGYNITADQPGFWEVTTSWAGNDKYLGSASEKLVVPYGLDIGRAIIAVCPPDSRPFYYTANRLGKLAYQTFASRRFDSPRIQYFDVNTDQDLNGDGFIRDVEGAPTLANIENAITSWAATAVNDRTPLCLYLIGEGSLDGMELSDGNSLTASHLHELLLSLESATGCDDIIIVVDAPHSGKFVSDLSKLGRCVITSANLGDAHYIAQGKLSFSQFFCNAASEGKSIRDAFLYTKKTLSKLPGGLSGQDPLVESDGNVIANESGDYLKTAQWYFGSSFGLQDLMPKVKSMSLASVTGSGGIGKIVTNSNGVLSDAQSPQLRLAKTTAESGVNVWLRVDDAEDNISSVYAVVFSPDDEVMDEIELFDEDADGKYEGTVYGLSELGAYDIVGYAFDESENVSEPMKSLVVVVDKLPSQVDEELLPSAFMVHAPYPNPFNPSTTIHYEIPKDAHVEFVVYDVLGRKIAVLQDDWKSAGVYNTVWNGKSDNGVNVGSGVYLYRVKAGEFVEQGKMVLVR
ncbi:T9SS type A sorting domain-containing protein [Candidatus Latescibacterota bacterium]